MQNLCIEGQGNKESGEKSDPNYQDYVGKECEKF